MGDLSWSVAATQAGSLRVIQSIIPKNKVENKSFKSIRA